MHQLGLIAAILEKTEIIEFNVSSLAIVVYEF